MAKQLRELGEFEVIREITERLPAGESVLLGPGDDAAVLSISGAPVVASTDVLVEGRHFRREWSSAYDVGRKAAAANMADIAAMGATATSLLVALVAPGDLEASWLLALADGLADEARETGAAVVGGDLSGGEAIVVSVTALGGLGGRAAVTRAGARPGDVVAFHGRLGYAAAGLAVLSRGFRSPRRLVEAHRRPVPPYAEGPRAAAAGARAMIDVSDGLVQDLGHIARASGVAIDVQRDRLQVPDALADVSAAFGVDPWQWILTGGDEHALAACFPPGGVPEGWAAIGSVSAGDGVTVDGGEWAQPGGHEHFRPA